MSDILYIFILPVRHYIIDCCDMPLFFIFINGSKNEFLNSTAQWGDGILSRTVDIYSFIQSCYGYDSF